MCLKAVYLNDSQLPRECARAPEYSRRQMIETEFLANARNLPGFKKWSHETMAHNASKVNTKIQLLTQGAFTDFWKLGQCVSGVSLCTWPLLILPWQDLSLTVIGLGHRLRQSPGLTCHSCPICSSLQGHRRSWNRVVMNLTCYLVLHLAHSCFSVTGCTICFFIRGCIQSILQWQVEKYRKAVPVGMLQAG